MTRLTKVLSVAQTDTFFIRNDMKFLHGIKI